jgi:hypothetical protein
MVRSDNASSCSVRRGRRPHGTPRNFLHENRETSEIPAGKPDGRSAGEGSGRTARVYVCEESHSGVLPMNHSNKDTRLSAESGEGRPLIKENAGQSNTFPTQSGKGVSQGLAGVRKAAREHKEKKFTALLHHLTVDLLRESFYSLKRKAAPRVDGVTWQEYESGLEDRLVDLHGRVHRGAYRALPSRRVYLQKEGGRQRPLGSRPWKTKSSNREKLRSLLRSAVVEVTMDTKAVVCDPLNDFGVEMDTGIHVTEVANELHGAAEIATNLPESILVCVKLVENVFYMPFERSRRPQP